MDIFKDTFFSLSLPLSSFSSLLSPSLSSFLLLNQILGFVFAFKLQNSYKRVVTKVSLSTNRFEEKHSVNFALEVSALI